MLKFLVVGTLRCGMAYTAQVLNRMGIACGHRWVYTPDRVRRYPEIAIVGDASPLAAPFAKEFNGLVLHQVRHPLEVIGSLVDSARLRNPLTHGADGEFWRVISSPAAMCSMMRCGITSSGTPVASGTTPIGDTASRDSRRRAAPADRRHDRRDGGGRRRRAAASRSSHPASRRSIRRNRCGGATSPRGPPWTRSCATGRPYGYPPNDPIPRGPVGVADGGSDRYQSYEMREATLTMHSDSRPTSRRALIIIPGTVNYFYNLSGERIAEALARLGVAVEIGAPFRVRGGVLRLVPALQHQ